MNWNCILERVAQTDSTNDDLMNRWRAGELIDPISRLAWHQKKGKGRAGRSWYANAKDSLSFSLAYPFDRSVQALHGLSLVCGLAVIKGLANCLQLTREELHRSGLALKWPNDLLIHGKKLGGILVEGGKLSPGKSNEKTWMIIGVGMNLQYCNTLEQASQIPISALAQLNSKKLSIDADLVWLAILDALGDYLAIFEREGFFPFQAEWKNWDAYHNQAVEIVELGQTKYSGIAIGVNQEGALLLIERAGQTPTAIYAGDLSLKKVHERHSSI
jgi:BirA family biotin operon repressor/biotin-[acetyl-CoA-carboxylase] ligase